MGIAFGKILPETQMHHAHDPPWIVVHLVGHRAGSGTHAALHTFVDILAAQFFDFVNERALFSLWQSCGRHIISLISWQHV